MISDLSPIFDRIYRENRWGRGSGPGSMPETTHEYRSWLQSYLDQNTGSRVLDIGCGDWSFSRLMDWTRVYYFGIDVVPSVIRDDNHLYRSNRVHFILSDVLDLPEQMLCTFDIVIIKDVLQHLSNRTVLQVFDKLLMVPVWLISNGMPYNGINQNIVDGGYRPIDVSKSPFSLNVTQELVFGDKTAHENRKVLFKRS